MREDIYREKKKTEPEILKVNPLLKGFADVFTSGFKKIQIGLDRLQDKEYPKVQKVEGKVEVPAIDNLAEVMKVDRKIVVEGLKELAKAIVEQPRSPEEVSVKNLKDLPAPIVKTEKVEFPTEDIKKITETLKTQKVDISAILAAFAKNPDLFVNVRLTDGKQWYLAIQEAITAGAFPPSALDLLQLISEKTPLLGQKVKANSTPVVVASDQDALSISSSSIDPQSTIKTFKVGSIATATNPTRLITASTVVKQGALIKADSANTGKVYIGDSTVTLPATAGTCGYELSAGESVFIPITNLNLLYAYASAASQAVFVMGV